MISDSLTIKDWDRRSWKNVHNISTNNWIIYKDLCKNYILLNTNTNEQITKVYDEGNERFLSAQEAVDALNNK